MTGFNGLSTPSAGITGFNGLSTPSAGITGFNGLLTPSAGITGFNGLLRISGGMTGFNGLLTASGGKTEFKNSGWFSAPFLPLFSFLSEYFCKYCIAYNSFVIRTIYIVSRCKEKVNYKGCKYPLLRELTRRKQPSTCSAKQNRGWAVFRRVSPTYYLLFSHNHR